MTSNRPYVGTELEIFARAQRWKRHWSSFVRPHLHGDVLEVGSGRGANISILQNERIRRWVCLEPDAALCEMLARTFSERSVSRVVHGSSANLDEREVFDAVL